MKPGWLSTVSASLALVFDAGRYYLQATTGWNSDKGVVDCSVERLPQVVEHGEISLRVAVDRDGICTFSWSHNGNDWQRVTPAFAASAGKWVGAKVGIYALSTQENTSKGSAQFGPFIVSPSL